MRKATEISVHMYETRYLQEPFQKFVRTENNPGEVLNKMPPSAVEVALALAGDRKSVEPECP